MKRRTILNLWKALAQLEGLKHDVRFSYFIAKNKVAIKPEMEALDEAQKPTEIYLEFEAKRVEAAQLYSDKDENGSPKVHNGQFVIFEKRAEFEKEIKKLKTKFKTAISGRDKQLADYETMLKDDVETVGLTKIRFSQLPKSIEPAFLEVFIEADVIMDDQDIKVVK